MLSQDEEGRGRIKLMRHNPERMRDREREQVRGRLRYEEIDKYNNRLCHVKCISERFYKSGKNDVINVRIIDS